MAIWINTSIGEYKHDNVKTWDNGGILALDTFFTLTYEYKYNRIGIRPGFSVNEDGTTFWGTLPSGILGNSTLTIGDKSVVIPIEDNDNWYWTWWYNYPQNIPDLQSFYYYDEASATGGFQYQHVIPYTWAFSGFTINGTIKVSETFQKYINDRVGSYGYTLYNFNDYDTMPRFEISDVRTDSDKYTKIEVALSSDGYSDDIIPFADLTNTIYNNALVELTYTSESLEILRSLPAYGYYVDVYYIFRYTWDQGLTATYVSDACTCELVSAPPTMNPVITDGNPATVALTGDISKLIRFMSDAHIAINADPGSSATIKTEYVVNNGITYSGSNPVIERIENGYFDFYMENSRGITLHKRVEIEVIPYVKLTCNKVYVNPPDNETGDIDFKVKGNCYKGSFGAVENTLTIQYRFKESSADNFTAWFDVPAANVHHYDGPVNTWDATGTIEALDYRNTYQVQFRAVDKLSTATTAIIRATSIPVFDWSKDDFNINVPTTIEGKVFGKNVILWHSSSGSQMTSTHTAYLTQPIQDQAHGIVLVFSAAGDNVSWSTHFVPKAMLDYNDGGGQTFMMANNAEIATFGAKYLYIYDDMIQGHSSNNTVASGYANSGIKFDNSKFVLRYVIGV